MPLLVNPAKTNFFFLKKKYMETPDAKLEWNVYSNKSVLQKETIINACFKKLTLNKTHVQLLMRGLPAAFRMNLPPVRSRLASKHSLDTQSGFFLFFSFFSFCV